MAVAAAAAAMHPSPPPPPARRTVAWLACAHLAWTAIICLLIASLWLFFWGWATWEIGWFACGHGCAGVTAAAYKVVHVAWVTFVVLILSIGLVALKMARAQAAAVVPVAAAAAATDIEATKEPALKTSNWAMRVRDLLRDPVILWFLASMAFALLKVIALVMGGSAVMGSRRQRMCAVIYYVGTLGMNAVGCFVLCPLITVRILRIWRKARNAL